jgi:acetylornithine deacetylase/succinyl-diaminopimelate desuccinylase-like protein
VSAKSIAGAVLLGAALVASARSVGAQQGGGSRPAAMPSAALARELLAEMIPHRTTETGNTTALAESLAQRFRAAGFPSEDVMVLGATARNRNLVVRLRGRDRARSPILFLAHLDVVDAEIERWRTDPWTLTERDGMLWGRGVMDDKGPAATIAAAFLEAKSAGFVPERDLVMALTAGEESGTDNGVQWLLANRPELVRAEYVVNADGGGGEMENGRRIAFNVQAAEKVYLDLTLSVRGPGGHSSMPDGPNPIERLSNGIARLARHEFPVNVTPVVRSYLAQRAPMTPGDLGAAMAAIGRNPQDFAAARTLSATATTNALIRTTCITTLVSGGTAPNAIPATATANVNCRVIPGERQEHVIEAIRQVLADPSIEIGIKDAMVPSDPSLMGPELRAALEATVAELYGRLPVITYMEMGATDGLYLRNAGIPVFGIIGLFASNDLLGTVHGNDERIPVTAFDQSAEFMRRLLRALGTR